MNAESDMEKDEDFSGVPWLPLCRNALRLVGLYFDAIRVERLWGVAVADQLAELTGGEPGPVILDRKGRRATYFLVPVGGTGHRTWPDGVTRLTGSVAGQRRNYFMGVPAYYAPTWPLSWHSRPTPDGRLVNPVMLHAVMRSLAEAVSDETRRRNNVAVLQRFARRQYSSELGANDVVDALREERAEREAGLGGRWIDERDV